MTQLQHLQDYYYSHKTQIIDEYKKFLSFPSISSEAEYASNVKECADWLAKLLKELDFEPTLWATSGYPVLFGSNTKAGPDKPTLLIYHHYDVQPVDPIELWKTPPFEPTIINNAMYARGAQDNKGQCFYSLQALKAILTLHKSYPINIKVIIEGEEECGSKGLNEILQKHKDDLKADYLAVVDVGIPKKDIPTVTLGVRGLVTFQIDVKGASIDLHSGSHGGVVYNPNHALAEILAGLRDKNGRITVPGFYDDVEQPSEEMLEELYTDFDPERYYESFHTEATGGEHQYSPVIRASLRPTLEVNGMWGGYTGDGFKTVIPSEAHAKISCRLVANQDPEKIAQKVIQYIESLAPPGIEVKVRVLHGGGKAVRANPNSEVVKAFCEAYTEVFKSPCRYAFSGGSIPVVTALNEASGSEVVLVGVGLAEDAIHSPNEHFGLDRFEQGFYIVARAIEIMGKVSVS